MKKKKDTAISIRVNKETHEHLSKIAEERNVSMSWVVRRAVLLYVRSQERRTQGPESTEAANDK